ncbi:MAG: hypothetical protein Q8Q71_00150 [Brevundimonas sp.]|nr:hypothetical protein [Brevundimonas sp.]MDP3800572.1 hypothetical protein [Brevundimonas sp.]
MGLLILWFRGAVGAAHDWHRRYPSKLIQGRTGPYEIDMGLEIHAQVASKAGLFSGATAS